MVLLFVIFVVAVAFVSILFYVCFNAGGWCWFLTFIVFVSCLFVVYLLCVCLLFLLLFCVCCCV